MGVETATLAAISAYASAAAAAVSVVGAVKQSSDAKANAKYNRQVEENRRSAEATQQKRQLYLANGTARAQAAGSGATLGSFEDVLDDNNQQGLLDIALGAYDSRVTQQRIKSQGSAAQSSALATGLSSAAQGVGSAFAGYSSYGKLSSQSAKTASTRTAAGKLSK